MRRKRVTNYQFTIYRLKVNPWFKARVYAAGWRRSLRRKGKIKADGRSGKKVEGRKRAVALMFDVRGFRLCEGFRLRNLRRSRQDGVTGETAEQ